MNQDNIDFKDWEFVLIDSEHQKKLNQWRHMYYLNIVSMCLSSTGTILILLARKAR